MTDAPSMLSEVLSLRDHLELAERQTIKLKKYLSLLRKLELMHRDPDMRGVFGAIHDKEEPGD